MLKKGIILILGLFLTASFAIADAIYLKSGNKIEGEITEKTGDYVKINFYGVELTYYKDQISKVVKSGESSSAVALEKFSQGGLEVRPNAEQPPHTGKSFLWKVNSKNGNLYLLGSVHAGKSQLYPLPKDITDAFEASETLAVEANINLNDLRSSLKMLEGGVYINGQTLQDHLNPKTFRLLEEKLNERGLNLSEYALFKPWFISLLLMSMELKKSGFDEELGIDKYFLNQASDKKILELEGADFQIRLFNEFPDDLQDLFLFSTLTGLDNLKVEMEQTLKVWLSGDIAGMEKIIFKAMLEYPGLSLLYEKLFYERNITMASKIEGFLKAGGNYFVVVGSGHMLGEKGILKLLERKGYMAKQL